MNPSSVSDHIQRAESLLSQSQAEDAKRILIPLLNSGLRTGYIRYLLGVAYSITQEHERAIAQYDLALLDQTLDVTDTANALSNKGVALEGLNHIDKALVAYESALELEPKLLRAAFNAGNACFKLQLFSSAEQHFRNVLKTNPENTQALMNLANCLFELNRYAEAEALYLKITELEPTYPPGPLHYGNALFQQGLFDKALAACDQALSLFPEYPEAMNLKASIFIEQHSYQAALELSQRAISLAPQIPEGHLNLGEALLNLNHNKNAIEAFQQAITLKPNYPDAFFYLGYALVKELRLTEGVHAYKHAIHLNPNFIEAHHNLGLVYTDLNQINEAICSLQKSIELKPDYAEAIYDLGNAFRLGRQWEKARNSYKKALQINPDIKCLKGDYLFSLIKECIWLEYEQLTLEIKSDFKKGAPASTPFITLYTDEKASEQRACAELYTLSKFPLRAFSRPTIGQSSPVRIGYLSCDFREHAVTYLTTGLIESHDRTKFTPIGLNTAKTEDTSPAGARIRDAFDKFISIGNVSDELAVNLIKNEQIDILVDLTGHTQGGRTGIFAYPAAPIQISYLGHPGTMGADYYDYIVADPILIPESSRAGFSEKIIYLPECFQANDRNKAIGQPSDRDAYGLPESSFIFASFNQSSKISPDVFSLWMSILQNVPESVIWLINESESTKSNLKQEASKAGISPDRLIFADSLPYKEHLARYSLVDLVLDTFPFNGGTTTSDALWGGAPVITMAGEAYASRMASSLLHNIGLEEMITSSPQEYAALAIQLATTPGKLSQIRSKLQQNLLDSPVFDTERFTRHFETGLMLAVERCRHGLKPDHIFVERLSK